MSWFSRCVSSCCCCCKSSDGDTEDAATRAWTAKWRDVITFVRDIAQSRQSGRHKTSRDAIFDCLLQLYAHEDFEEMLRSLYDIYETDPQVVLHYLPQLAIFLLYGRMPQSERLEAYLLDKSEKSLHFAHMLHFFLRSYAPNVVYASLIMQGTGARVSLADAVQTQGSFAAARLARIQMPHVYGEAKITASIRPSDLSAQGAIEPVVLTRQQANPTETELRAATILDSIVLSTATPTNPEAAHFNTVAPMLVPNPMRNNTTYGTLETKSQPKDDALRLPIIGDSSEVADNNPFYDTPAICNQLTHISYQLMTQSAEARNDVLRLNLHAVNAKYLPSRTAYVPIGNIFNRIITIHPEQSFCFKTKERVPYMVVIEVVDYANRSGGPLEESDSDDDDYSRARARRLRAANRPPSRRGRSHTMEAAADAASAAAALVRSAAGRVGEVISERAQAISSYVRRQFQDPRAASGGSSPGLRSRLREDSSQSRSGLHQQHRSTSPVMNRMSAVGLELSTRSQSTGQPAGHGFAPHEGVFSRSRVASADRCGVDLPHERLINSADRSSVRGRRVTGMREKQSRAIDALQLQQSSQLERPLISEDGSVLSPVRALAQAREALHTPVDLGQWSQEQSLSPQALHYHPPGKTPQRALLSPEDVVVDMEPICSPASAPASIGMLPIIAAAGATAVAENPLRKMTTVAPSAASDVHGNDALVNDEELDRELRDLPAIVDTHDMDELDSSQLHPEALSAADVGSLTSPMPGTVVRRQVERSSEERPATVVFAERWAEKEARVARTSRYSRLPGWRLMPVIVKAHDDLRQEQFASQLLRQFFHIFRASHVPVWMRPYDILATHADGGLIEAIPDTISIDALKRGDPHFTTLDGWFERHFNYGAHGAQRANLARMNFVRSMAAYSIVCYILNIKDRHNGNILIDRVGHVIHIDFGFLFTNSPGGNINFEAAPFKLTQELVDVMGGPRSSLFSTYRKLCIQAFLAVRKYRERILLLVQMMLTSNRDLKCFLGGESAVMDGLRYRFHAHLSDRECVSLVHSLIDRSVDNWRTRWYDAYQRWAQGVF